MKKIARILMLGVLWVFGGVGVRADIAGGDCEAPVDAVYVDGTCGSSDGTGSTNCPLSTISEGLAEAEFLGITNVIAISGVYPENVRLKDGIQLIAKSEVDLLHRLSFAVIIPTSTVESVVFGANNAALKYFWVVGNVALRNCDNMLVQGNIIDTRKESVALAVVSDADANRIENNLVIGVYSSNVPSVVQLESNSDTNVFLNNTFFMLYSGPSNKVPRRVVRIFDGLNANEFRNNIADAKVSLGNTWCGFGADGANHTTVVTYTKTGPKNDNVTLSSTCITVGPANFVSPLPTGYDYSLTTTSVCVDSGDPSTTYNDPDGTRNDMGAHGGPNALDLAP